MAHDWTAERWTGLEIIPSHFDLPHHCIPLETFVRTAEETKAIVNALNGRFFGGALEYEFLVFPPEEGSFLSKLGLVLIGGWTFVYGFVESDIGKAFIKGLTDHEPAYWAEMTGREVKNKVISPPLVEALIDDDPSKVDVSSPDQSDSEKKQCAAKVVVEATKGFIKLSTDALEAVGISPREFREGFAARNEFWSACSDSRLLRGVGFSEEPIFPIKRPDFARLQVVLPPREDDKEPWVTGIAALKVTSPNWDRDDGQRGWKAKDVRGRERFFRIVDEHFWHLVNTKQISVLIIDTIKVQWAYRGPPENPRQIRVLKVLEYNDQHLSEPLDDNALRASLGVFHEAKDPQMQLF